MFRLANEKGDWSVPLPVNAYRHTLYTVLLSLGLALFAARVEARPSSVYSGASWSGADPSPKACAGAETVLLIQDVVPWDAAPDQDPNGADVTELEAQGKNWCAIGSADIGSTNLSGFKEIVIAAAQTQAFYNNLFPGGTIHPSISSWVSNGGILSANLADNASGPGNGGSWDGYVFVGGVTKVTSFSDDNQIAAPLQPIVRGSASCPGGNCSRIFDAGALDDLDDWGSSSHGFLTNLPAGTLPILTDENANPVMIQYSFGKGLVVASMTSTEWRYVGDFGTLPQNKKLLANDIAFQDAPTFPSFDGLAETTYYDVATSRFPSASGYGGPGSSGGAGEALLRIVNPTRSDPTLNGTLCAMIYVFDDREELQSCCGCPVTPNGVRTLSTINDLTGNFGVNQANRNAGVIEVISSRLNFVLGVGGTPPLGINVAGGLACDPTGAVGSASGSGVSGAVDPTPTLLSEMMHTEALAPSAPPFAPFSTSASAERFQNAPLDQIQLSSLQTDCMLLLANSSGAGVCNCGAGEKPAVATSLRAAPRRVSRYVGL